MSPLVNEGAEDGVRVLPITSESVLLANRAPYVPRSLPEVFSQVTGGGSGGLGGAGMGLPPAPVFPNLTPGSLELRPPPSAPPQPYLIGVGDVVQLATRSAAGPTDLITGGVSGTELRQRYTVRDDGAIGLPELGAVQIGGLTIDEAEQRLFERFVEAGIDPNFSLEIAEFNAQTITVGGAVGTPSILPVTLNQPTLEEALTAAGGIQVSTPEFASIRIYRDGTLYQIPLGSYNQSGDLRDLALAPGDSVFVDTSYDLDRALAYYTQQINAGNLRMANQSAALSQLQTEISLRRAALEEARGLFRTRLDLDAEERDYVYLAGEVGQQGRYTLPFGRQATLADALYENRGFETETANPNQIYVLRATDGSFGGVTAWHLDARNAANLLLATRFEMRPNDIVFIEEQPITRWNRAFQQFFPTLINTATAAAE